MNLGQCFPRITTIGSSLPAIAQPVISIPKMSTAPGFETGLFDAHGNGSIASASLPSIAASDGVASEFDLSSGVQTANVALDSAVAGSQPSKSATESSRTTIDGF